MIKYQTLQGLRLSGAVGLPVITPTPEGVAMGAVPGWRFLLDPGRRSDDLMRNRVVPNEYVEPWSGGSADPFIFGTFSNGAPALELSGDNNMLRPNVSFDPNVWTVFAVQQLDDLVGGSPFLITASDSQGGPIPRMGVNATGINLAIWKEGTNVRVGHVKSSPGYVDETPHLFMFTFSTRDGCRVFLDGEELAHEPNDTEPLAHNYGAGQWRLLASETVGKVGMVGMLSTDLGWPEHAGYRRAIERFLMDKYGIG